MRYLKSILEALKLSYRSAPVFTILQVILTILMTVFPYLSLSVTANLLNRLTNFSNLKISEIGTCLIVISCSNVIMDFMNNVLSCVQYCRYEKTACEINNHIIQKATTVKIEVFDNPQYLDALNAFINNSSSINAVIENTLSLFSGMISLICALVLFRGGYFFQACLIMLATIPSFCVERKIAKKQNEIKLENLKKDRQRNYFFNISSDKRYAYDIRLHGMSKYLSDKYKKLWEECFLKLKQNKQHQYKALTVVRIIPEIFSIFFMAQIVNDVVLRKIEIGSVVLYIGLVGSLIQITLLVMGNISYIYEDALKLSTLKWIDSYSSENSEAENLMCLEDVDSIVFQNVYFKYTPIDPYIIQNLSFSISKGDFVCLWGKNGSGKSTVFKLLLRYYDATEGEILINSIDIKQYSVESIRKVFNQAFQSNIVYAFSLKENFYTADFSKGYVLDDEILKLFQLVSGVEILDKMDNGVNGKIYKIFDPNGYEPSGGEYQKIALARTLYRNSSVILLDEVTAAFDKESEEEFFRGIKEMASNKIVIFTSHNSKIARTASKLIHLKTPSHFDIAPNI